MISKTLFHTLLNEYQLGYALISKKFIVSDCNSFFEKFVVSQTSAKGKSVFELIDELVGLEPQLQAVIKSNIQSFALDNINRGINNNETAYFNLKILSTGDDNNPLILFVKNTTEYTDLYRLSLQQKKEIQLLESIVSSKNEFLSGSILGDSQPIVQVKEKVKKISVLPTTTVLLQGESGTGKSLVARVIHYSSSQNKPFVEINCAAIPENLLESELFGYEKGAFTNAITDKAGLLEEADGGTLFLDEISELPLKLQSKLLTFLETRRFRRLGSNVEKQVKVRFITATNKVLSELVKKGEFR